MSYIRADVLSAANGTSATTLTGQVAAKSWTNFSGSAMTIRGSFNTSSITNRASGRFSVAFTTAMIDDSYSSPIGVGSSDDDCGSAVYTNGSSEVRIASSDQGPSDNAWYNVNYVFVAVFR